MYQRCRSFSFDVLRLQASYIQSRYNSTLSKVEAKQRRNFLFDEEKKKYKNSLGRIEKIEVIYQSPVEEIVLVMNKCLSTPADCAKHITEGVVKVSALALVDDTPWDMHRPLVSNCKLKLLNLQSPPDQIVNKAFWRTCSFLLGAMIESSFKPEIGVHLHSFPVPRISSGSFIYDVHLELPDWKPVDQELRAMSAQFMKLANQELPIERIQTTKNIALEMFQENPFKSRQIPEIAKLNDDIITLYRVGDHIDISKGPMVGNTNLVGRCTVAAVHKLTDSDNLYRFQGVALPKGILLNHFAYQVLEARARKFNESSWMTQQDNIEAPVKMSVTN
ncbi:39S ribosomal protein L39, mitochondrial [Hylaeus anthracinus]|uniref:39S ribosomal protein L39, mitochondrial n=1 Tax=Hylaeus anthracinus TaxID=313031 RepID=UPI0023BA39DD|nr:39S ribosomal protein L39, mitochondrial [Hylaeus anthracinus]XP_054000910.1 39S ribosomal protein L39, mitochondrial [Hylaeus anthracinus]XP_054000919.1 39S ribosomal protein L39, mitochondrial [Hylaeus anthracinus]